MGTRSKMYQDRLAIIPTIAGIKDEVTRSTQGNRATRRAALSRLRRHNKASRKYHAKAS